RAPLDVRVEEARDVLWCRVGRLLRRSRPTRIASSLDLADEHALPIACFLERLDRPLLVRIHPRDRELVDRHAVSRSAMRHVEVQVLQAPSRVRARSFAASSPNGHTTSFMLGLL